MENSTQTKVDNRVGPSMEVLADADGLVVPDAYKPCHGTWSEFKGDVKGGVRTWKEIWAERFANVHEKVADFVEHRRHHSAS